MIRLWDVAGRRERLVLAGHTEDVNAVAFLSDGKTLASGSLDRVARLWDVATGREIGILKGHRGAVEALAFSPDGETLATASGDNTTILWNLADKTQRRVSYGCRERERPSTSTWSTPSPLRRPHRRHGGRLR